MFGKKKIDIDDQSARPDINIFAPASSGDSEIKEATDMSEVIKEMFNDVVDINNRVSSIDMKARLGAYEIVGILAVDTLVGFKVLPLECIEFTRRKKRLSVSTDGLGRSEIVSLFRGNEQREMEKKGFLSIKK